MLLLINVPNPYKGLTIVLIDDSMISQCHRIKYLITIVLGQTSFTTLYLGV